MKKRFICYGGYVISNNDGELHYVNAVRVAQLHKVDPRECILVSTRNIESRRLHGVDTSCYLELHPSNVGCYSPVGPAERRAYPVGDEDWPR